MRLVIISILIILCFWINSCSNTFQEDTGYPIHLIIAIENVEETVHLAISKQNPCHVVAFEREKACSPFYFLFEDNAYLSGDGQLKWSGKFRYWPGRYCKFVAWWPADANVELDDAGNIISADCTLIAVSDPYCQFTENPVLIFKLNYKDDKQESQESEEEEKGEPIRFDVSVTDYKR